MTLKTFDFGGNIVKRCAARRQGKEVFCVGPYEYFIYSTAENEEVRFGELRSFTVYVLQASDHSVVTAAGLDGPLKQGDRIQAEDRIVELAIHGGSVQLLVAGTHRPHPDLKGLTLARNKDLYRVMKPWGHELWINGNHPCYALKEIFLKASTKTSLQYHRHKQETNVLFEGSAKLHYKRDAAVANDQVSASDTAAVRIDPVSTVDVMPETLHRLEAITDLLLYETSTPHLDDVVRILDDSNRQDGRIQGEHLC